MKKILFCLLMFVNISFADKIDMNCIELHLVTDSKTIRDIACNYMINHSSTCYYVGGSTFTYDVIGATFTSFYVYDCLISIDKTSTKYQELRNKIISLAIDNLSHILAGTYIAKHKHNVGSPCSDNVVIWSK